MTSAHDFLRDTIRLSINTMRLNGLTQFIKAHKVFLVMKLLICEKKIFFLFKCLSLEIKLSVKLTLKLKL